MSAPVLVEALHRRMVELLGITPEFARKAWYAATIDADPSLLEGLGLSVDELRRIRGHYCPACLGEELNAQLDREATRQVQERLA